MHLILPLTSFEVLIFVDEPVVKSDKDVLAFGVVDEVEVVGEISLSSHVAYTLL